MLLFLFILLSLPIGCFALWFGWKAHQAGKRNVVFAMGWLALISFGMAVLSAGWAYAMWSRGG